MLWQKRIFEGLPVDSLKGGGSPRRAGLGENHPRDR
jgi:hypothetical protein